MYLSAAFIPLMAQASPCPPPIVGPSDGDGTVYVGHTLTLTNDTPSGVWSSSNPAVATVDPTTGLVTGVGVGSCNIIYTVTAECGASSSAPHGMAVFIEP